MQLISRRVKLKYSQGESTSNNCLHQHSALKTNFFYTDFLLFIEIKTKHIPFLQTIVVEILCQLLFSSLIVSIPAPDFQFYHKLFPTIIYNYICAFQIPCPGFHIIVSYTVDDWS